MHSYYVEIMGLVAAVCTTTSFLPQLIRTWRTGGHDLSYYMLAIFLLGVTLWLIYGIILHAMPIILANVFTSLQVLAIIVLKLVRERSARLAPQKAR
ncbi:MAG: SemiSWEET family sugar transporter [Blastocatellia bacterium]